MLRARRTIVGHVKSGHPVLVGCAFEPKTSMLKEGFAYGRSAQRIVTLRQG